jgi:hypothetical protein
MLPLRPQKEWCTCDMSTSDAAFVHASGGTSVVQDQEVLSGALLGEFLQSGEAEPGWQVLKIAPIN